MIQRQTAVRFYVGEQEFSTLRDAQMAELGNLFAEPGHPLIRAMLDHSAKVVDILTTNESSLAKARKINGGRKPRKSKVLPVVPATGNPVTTTDA